jgi:hypothetical protein
MSLRKSREMRLANLLLEQRYLTEQPAPAPGPAPAPAPSPAPVSGPTTTTTTKNSTPTTTTTTIKLTEKDLDNIPNCSSGKFGVTPETFTEMKVGNYTVHTQKTPAKNSVPLKCKK